VKPGDIVFLSASVPTREGWREDARPLQIEEAVIALARGVFARRGRLLFGGHPSISPLITSVAGEYLGPDPRRAVRPVITFQSEYFRGSLPDETWDLYRMGWASIQWTPVVKGADEQATRRNSLALMRDWMLLGSSTPKDVAVNCRLSAPIAMVAVGGMEGVCEETAVFLRRQRDGAFPPGSNVYVIATGGGAARRLAYDPERAFDGVRDELGPENSHALIGAKKDGRLVVLDSDSTFPPYAAITQRMLDTLD